jgi:hypothetical protein
MMSPQHRPTSFVHLPLEVWFRIYQLAFSNLLCSTQFLIYYKVFRNPLKQTQFNIYRPALKNRGEVRKHEWQFPGTQLTDRNTDPVSLPCGHRRRAADGASPKLTLRWIREYSGPTAVPRFSEVSWRRQYVLTYSSMPFIKSC